MSALKENRARFIEVTAKDLPLHCPMPDMVKWNQHPRVFLSFDKGQTDAKCPYCGTEYKLIGPAKTGH